MPNKHSSNRPDKDGEFPAGLVVLGLVLVAIVWVGLVKPDILDLLPFHSASQSPTNPQRAASIQETTTSPQPLQATPNEPEKQEATSTDENDRGPSGRFYRYTDDNGTINLVDNPENIPEKYRHQTKVYNSHKQTTQVRVVNNQVLVPVNPTEKSTPSYLDRLINIDK